jgi:coenzyme F420-0:L-glutamate ligase/coenzyme F420-1:gamma-L-glutamate ligase
VAAEAVRVVARRGTTVVAETRHGLVLAAAGVDMSNVPDGRALILPADADATARRLRRELAARLGVNVGIVVTDTAGRAWREGQIDIAIGCAGVRPLLDLRGRPDAAGRMLAVTTPAVADEIAALGDLVKGKTAGRPVAVVRGLAGLVLPEGDDGPGATALARGRETDLFGLGTRDAAVAAALRDDAEALAHFPTLEDAVDPFAALSSARSDVRVEVSHTGGAWTVWVCVEAAADDAALLEAGRLAERAATLAAAHRLSGVHPADMPSPTDGWRAVHGATWVVA